MSKGQECLLVVVVLLRESGTVFELWNLAHQNLALY